MSYKYQDPDSGEIVMSAMNDLFDQNMELIAKQMEEVLRDVLIPDLEKNAAKNKLKQDGLRTVPQIWLDEEYIGGYVELERRYNV